MKPHLFGLLALGALAACSNSGANYTPILDGAPTRGFQDDLTACQSLARDQRQFDQETIAAAVLGAATGAVFGELDKGSDALGGAIAGAIFGGAASAIEVSGRREDIVVSCLRGRGHRVVG